MPASSDSSAPLVVLMGVAGSGKTTVGRLLATTLSWAYHEADDFHSPANRAKMAAGKPLDDVDREPWLRAIHEALVAVARRGEPGVFTCSALKENYRRLLLDGLPQARLVFLTGDRELLRSRIAARRDHYMKPEMLGSQLAALEPPADALTLDIRRSPEQLVAEIRRHLRL